MVQKNIVNNDADEKQETDSRKRIIIPEDVHIKLDGMGFVEKVDKTGLFCKDLESDKGFYWDFRKTDKGTAYVATDNGFLDDKEVKMMDEYKVIRGDNGNGKVKKSKVVVPASDMKAVVPSEKKRFIRGTERDVVRLMDKDLQLDSIIDASPKNKLGEGLLWHELVFGKGDKKTVHVEPSAELVDVIAQDMGNVSVKIVEFGNNNLEDPNTHEKYLTYYCVAEATDGLTGTSGLGAAEQIIDFDEIKKTGRSFDRTLVIRKASRNAIERLIPIPRKAMVYLIRKKLEEHSKKKEKKQ